MVQGPFAWTAVVLAVVAWNLAMFAGRSFGPWYPTLVTGLALASISQQLADVRPLLRVHLRAWVGAAILLAVMLAASYGGYALTSSLPEIRGPVQNLYAWMGNVGPVESVLLPVIILCEEVTWRGGPLEALASRIGPIRAVLVSSVFYGLAHLLALEPILAPVAFLCGIGWGLLRVFTRSLPAVFVCHYAWDVIVLQLAPIR